MRGSGASAGASGAEGVAHRPVGADALQDGVGSDAVGQLAHRGAALLAPLGDHVGGPEGAGDGLTRLVTRHRDDRLGAHLAGREHAAEPQKERRLPRAVWTHERDAFAWLNRERDTIERGPAIGVAVRQVLSAKC